MKDGIPFELPSSAEVVQDHNKGYNSKELIARLREKEASRVDIGGEFLWLYRPDINKNLRKYAKKLPG